MLCLCMMPQNPSTLEFLWTQPPNQCVDHDYDITQMFVHNYRLHAGPKINCSSFLQIGHPGPAGISVVSLATIYALTDLARRGDVWKEALNSVASKLKAWNTYLAWLIIYTMECDTVIGRKYCMKFEMGFHCLWKMGWFYHFHPLHTSKASKNLWVNFWSICLDRCSSELWRMIS